MEKEDFVISCGGIQPEPLLPPPAANGSVTDSMIAGLVNNPWGECICLGKQDIAMILHPVPNDSCETGAF